MPTSSQRSSTGSAPRSICEARVDGADPAAAGVTRVTVVPDAAVQTDLSFSPTPARSMAR
jgi:hypothetical protein